MNSESMKAYTARISQANKSELTVIVFDILIEETEEGLALLEQGRKEDAVPLLKKGQMFLMELVHSLNLRVALAKQLFSLYQYMNKVFLTAIRKKEPGELPAVLGMVRQLRESFAEVAKQDTSPPLMENTQKLYAGLTYGKGSLNEVSLDVGDSKRGFMV